MVQISGFTGSLGTGNKQGIGAQLAALYQELAKRLGDKNVVNVASACTPGKELGQDCYKPQVEEGPDKGHVMAG